MGIVAALLLIWTITYTVKAVNRRQTVAAVETVEEPQYEDLDNTWRRANGYEALVRTEKDLHDTLLRLTVENGGTWAGGRVGEPLSRVEPVKTDKSRKRGTARWRQVRYG